jgi:hypothetical protein
MNRSKRLFKLIQKKLAGLMLCKDMLVVPPTEHIVKGFLSAIGERQSLSLEGRHAVAETHQQRDPGLQ